MEGCKGKGQAWGSVYSARVTPGLAIILPVEKNPRRFTYPGDHSFTRT